MTFRQWYKEAGGANTIGKLLGVSPYTVRYWLRGEGSPTFETALAIVESSKGKMSFAHLFNFTTRKKNAK